MDDPAAQTTHLIQWVDRIRAGDASARDELIRGFQGRLELLARKMVVRDRRISRWVDAEDVLQNALLRLLRALESVRPDSTRAFLGLAAVQMRRELLDLTRHFYGPEGEGAHHDSVRPPSDDGRPGFDPSASGAEPPEELELWCKFHEEVDRLPVREREMVGLIYYHGWTQAQVAELFHVNERTVRRWWQAALERLRGLEGIRELWPADPDPATGSDPEGPLPLELRISEEGRLVYLAQFDGPIELGRQHGAESGPYCRHNESGRWRVVIAARSEDGVSRRQVLLEPGDGGLVRIANPSEKTPVGLAIPGAERRAHPPSIGPGAGHELRLTAPILLAVGRATIRVSTAGGSMNK